MTAIQDLIRDALTHAPFLSVQSAQTFLNKYSIDDQAALISALYIGRDHIHNTVLQPDYIPNGVPFNRYFHTGNAPTWLIQPSEFARTLYEKNPNLTMYYESFIRCATASGHSLNNF